MALLRNGVNRNQFRMKQENELKSLLTVQQFEASDNRELLLAQAKACANGYALATEGIAVVSDFLNNECHIYAGKFGQATMNLPEYMVDRNSAFEDIIFRHAKEDELIERHVLELRFFNFIKELEILSLIAKGVPSKQIAGNLNISIYTVNRHRQDILAALKVANTAAAVEIALRMNLI